MLLENNVSISDNNNTKIYMDNLSSDDDEVVKVAHIGTGVGIAIGTKGVKYKLINVKDKLASMYLINGDVVSSYADKHTRIMNNECGIPHNMNSYTRMLGIGTIISAEDIELCDKHGDVFKNAISVARRVAL